MSNLIKMWSVQGALCLNIKYHSLRNFTGLKQTLLVSTNILDFGTEIIFDK